MISGGSHPLDEREIADLKQQLTEAEADRQSLQQRLEHLEAALAALKPASASEDWHREYGVVLVRVMRERDEAREQIGKSSVNAGLKVGLTKALELASLTAAALSDAGVGTADAHDSQDSPSNSQPWEQAAELAKQIVVDADRRRDDLAVREAGIWSDWDSPEDAAYDADLADINRRADADKRLIDAAVAMTQALRYVPEGGLLSVDRDLIAAVDARRALDDPEVTITQPVPPPSDG